MKKIFASALVAGTVMMASPAMAATNIPLTQDATGLFSGNFASGTKSGGPFTDAYEFTIPTMGVVGASVISLQLNGLLELTEVLLNNEKLTITSTANGNFFADSPKGGIPSIANPQTLVIKGTVLSSSGTYTGNVQFRSAVPEPATWALMILGFGVVGYAMRRRPSVRFAQAI